MSDISARSDANGGAEPTASRPHIPGYGVPTSAEGTLPWSHVVERMEGAVNYWIATAGSGGEPHATPVWGLWLDGAFYFDGSPQTRRGRHLAVNPRVAVHLESGNDVVILEGEALEIRGPGPELARRLSAAYTTKYASLGYEPAADTWDTGGLYLVHPRLAFAWTRFPADATRWRLDAD